MSETEERKEIRERRNIVAGRRPSSILSDVSRAVLRIFPSPDLYRTTLSLYRRLMDMLSRSEIYDMFRVYLVHLVSAPMTMNSSTRGLENVEQPRSAAESYSASE